MGYRFIGKLTEQAAFQTATLSEDRSHITRRKWALLLLGIPALLFAILLWGSKRLVLQPSNRPPKIVQFTASPGLDLHPTFSPDGTNVAYASDRSGRFEIYVHPVASGGREVQITSDNQQNLEPAWSPDGGYIAYTSQVRRGILVVPALGGTPQRLTDFGSQPVWSPDGSQIAFRSEGVFSLAPIDAAPSAGWQSSGTQVVSPWNPHHKAPRARSPQHFPLEVPRPQQSPGRPRPFSPGIAGSS